MAHAGPTNGPAWRGGPYGRLTGLDAHRGLIMMVMAIDHASYFVARVHSLEIWGAALPSYPDVAWFWTRWVTHLCAPGFFFLMGVSMALFAAGRRRAGWVEARITRFFVVRGFLLVLLQLIVEDPAWVLGDLSAAPGLPIVRGGPMPGEGAGVPAYFGVLYALGGAMVFWAFLRRAPLWLIAVLSAAAVGATQVVTPGFGREAVLYSPLARLLFIPGQTGRWVVLYPLVSWLGPAGLGLIFGRFLQKDEGSAGTAAGLTGLAFLFLFVITRIGGGFGNLNAVPPGWVGFLNVVKYPPSLAFLSIFVAVNLMLMAAWRRAGPLFSGPFNPLRVFGRTALFFYLVHLWFFTLLGLFFRAGCGLAAMYGCWLLGLAILYPLCIWYDRLKRRTAVDSFWRFF